MELFRLLVVQWVSSEVCAQCWACQALIRALRLGHHNAGVVWEGAWTEVVVVDTLSMCLQIALHVFRAEGEARAGHG